MLGTWFPSVKPLLTYKLFKDYVEWMNNAVKLDGSKISVSNLNLTSATYPIKI